MAYITPMMRSMNTSRARAARHLKAANAQRQREAAFREREKVNEQPRHKTRRLVEGVDHE